MTTTKPANANPVSSRRHGIVIPLWTTVTLLVAIVATMVGSTWWTAQIVYSTYHQGFDDGWYRGQRTVKTQQARKPIQTRIPPEPTQGKTHQPPG